MARISSAQRRKLWTHVVGTLIESFTMHPCIKFSHSFVARATRIFGRCSWKLVGSGSRSQFGRYRLRRSIPTEQVHDWP
ncbi:Uncharacterized protein HZ326_12253 [Fusarium oxysporum f. sp. albedinis]|nr:Uncharacterized protein HZ326_12253 [Fusarium oxysporum f. sp. albedinis]